MAKTTDPQGIAAERIKLNALVVQLSSSVANYVGDRNGLADLQTKLTEANYRLNITNASNLNASGFDSAFSLCGFGLEQVSTT